MREHKVGGVVEGVEGAVEGEGEAGSLLSKEPDVRDFIPGLWYHDSSRRQIIN